MKILYTIFSPAKFVKIFNGVLVLAFLFVVISNVNLVNKNGILLRNLLTDGNIDEVCSKSTKSLLTMYEKIDRDYVYQAKKTTSSEYLIQYFKATDSDGLTKYVGTVIPYIIFILFGVFTLVGWLVMCGCLCCPTLCCKENPDNDEGCFRKSSFLISVIMLGGVAVGTFFSFAFSSSFSKSVNGTSCAFFKFYQTLKDGEKTEELPKWNGVTEIIKSFNDIQKYFENIDDNKEKIKVIHDTVEEKNEDIIKNYLDDFPTGGIDFYNKEGESKEKINVIPKFYEIFTDAKTEYSGRIESGVKIIKSVNDGITSIDTTKVNEFIESGREGINSIEPFLKSLEEDVLNGWYKYQTQYNDYASVIFYPLFTVECVLGILGIVFLIIYVCCYNKRMRLGGEVVFHLMMLFASLSFIIGAVLGIVGKVSGDGINLISYTFGNENINSDNPILINFDNEEDKKVINTCMNGNGNLYKALGLDNKDVGKQLDNLLKDSVDLETTLENIKPPEGTTQEYFDTSIKKYAVYKEGKNQEELKTYLPYFKKYLESKSCNTEWVIEVSDCQKKRCEKSGSQIDGCKGECCISLSEYNENKENVKLDDEQKERIKPFEDYLDQLKKGEKLGKLQEQATDLDIVGKLGELKENIKTFTSSVREATGDGKIEEMINCKFMKTNINILYKQLGDNFSGDSSNIGAMIIATAICEVVAVFFGVIAILRYLSVYPYDSNVSGLTESNLLQQGQDISRKEIEMGEISKKFA